MARVARLELVTSAAHCALLRPHSSWPSEAASVELRGLVAVFWLEVR